jgi:glycyl-tRNA synthetase beta subunit
MATRSKHRKNHKEKLEARKKRLADEKKKTEKFQREFIMNLIKQEQEKGLFDNTQTLNPTEGPVLNGPIVDGPLIDGPSI